MQELTSYERFVRRLGGEPVDRTPNFNIMMTFAAHFIGEPLSRYYQDFRVLTEANLAVQESFNLDILQVISDPYREAADFGLQVHFPEDDLPVAREPLLSKPADLINLTSPDPGNGKRMSDRLEAIRLLHQRKGGQVPIMGWVEGALAEAADLRGMLPLMIDLTLRPDWVVELLEQIVRWKSSLPRNKSRLVRPSSGWGMQLPRRFPLRCTGSSRCRTKNESLLQFTSWVGLPGCIFAVTPHTSWRR